MISKVVEASGDSILNPDGAALSAFQYFENVRNFLDAMEDKGHPTFEASDLEKGGKGSRVVDSVLALKSYSECKQIGKKYGGVSKPYSAGKFFFKSNSEPFTNSLPRSQSLNQDELGSEHSLNEHFSIDTTETKSSNDLNMLVRSVLSDKKPEDVPLLVEAMISKVMQEFERRIVNQNEMVKADSNGNTSISNKSVPQIDIGSTPITTETETKVEEDSSTMSNEDSSTMSKEDDQRVELIDEDETNLKLQDEANLKLQEEANLKLQDEANLKLQDESKNRILKQNLIFDRQQREIKDLKHALRITKAGVEFMKSQYSEEFNNLGKHLRIISNAASGYYKVLEENRKLYNQVQDLKGNIRVYCRVRPFLPGQLTGMNTIGHLDNGGITIITPSKYGKEGSRAFNFNRVFGPSASQEEVFSDTQPLIRSVLDGFNVCIFAYGQTGTGKTFTMSGPNELTEQSIGVNYRALNDLFYISEQRKDTFRYEISVQMLEIYNEQVRDLLDSDGLNKRLEIRNSSQNGVNVPDANLVPVATTSDVIDLMNIGQKNRAVSATAMNDRSSRSHSCLTIHVQGKDLTSGNTFRGSMHLVDLAGSERVDRSEVKGDRLKEAQHINKSLAALGDVISSLAQKNTHVPYRNSKLTQLLQDSLGGQAKTLMFVHISPEMDSVGETLSTLKFAERVSTIELGAAKVNKDNGEVKELREQIATLKEALARKEGEWEPIRSSMSSPDILRMKSGIMPPDSESFCSLSNLKQPMEYVRKLEVQNNSAEKSKKPDFDFQELLMSSDSLWTDSSQLNLQKGEDTEMGSDWVDKIMGNRLESDIKDDDSVRDSEGESNQLPNSFYQKYSPNMKKEIPEFDNQRRFESDSDDLDMATSDSSELDMHYQFSLPKSSLIKPKVKKPKSKAMKIPDTRTTSQSLIPSPSRKVLNGPTQIPTRAVKSISSANGDKKRPVSSGKMGSGK